jgi:5-oxoprolinase (ATP-hydrolysing) subunit B
VTEIAARAGETGPPFPRIDPMGDAALLVTLGDEFDLDLNARALRLADELLARADGRALGAPVPGVAGVLVPFDPAGVAEADVREAILDALRAMDGGMAGAGGGPGAGAGRGVGDEWRRRAADAPARGRPPGTRGSAGREIVIPVAYGGSAGPDLAEVAARTGLGEDEVVRLHSSVDYRVLVVGFAPGFAYLGPLPDRLELPRRAEPRVRVPAGSVAIAGRQTGVYPLATPGGWHIVGRTDVRLWDPSADPPALLRPGDRVRFVPG